MEKKEAPFVKEYIYIYIYLLIKEKHLKFFY